MRGVPVWLASVSRWNGQSNVPTGQWSESQLREAKRVAHEALAGVGNAEIERGFFTCSTLCVHRAVTQVEESMMPFGPGYLAGPPGVRVVWETEKAPAIALSFMPCKNRYFKEFGQLKLPVDNCHECESCIERDRIVGSIT
jgi:hypothetical protein